MILFYWLVAVMPLDRHWLWGRELFGTITVIKALGLVCFLFALLRIVAGSVSTRRFYGRQALPFIVFAILLCLATLQTLPTHTSVAYSHVLSVLVLFTTALALVDSEVRLYRTALLVVGSAGFASLYAIRQHTASPDAFGDFRAAGIFLDANQYALVVDLWIPLAFILAFSQKPVWERLFCFGCLVSTLLGSTFAASRGGFLGLVAAFLYLILRSRRPLRNLAIVSALMLPLVLGSSSSPLRRLQKPSQGDQQAQENRWVTWKAGLRMIQSHPLTGIGMHNFLSLVSSYEDPDRKYISLAHNTYIEIAAEMGTPALIAFIGLLVATFSAQERVRRRAQTARLTHLSGIALGLQAGLLSYVVSAFFMSAWWEKMFWMLIFTSMCMYQVSARVLRLHLRNNDPRPRGQLMSAVSIPSIH